MYLTTLVPLKAKTMIKILEKIMKIRAIQVFLTIEDQKRMEVIRTCSVYKKNSFAKIRVKQIQKKINYIRI
jgi:hypothetical protein